MTTEVKEDKPVSEEELSAYEQMVADRLDTLKKAYDDFSKSFDGDTAQSMPAFVMLHVAQLYARLDILLDDLSLIHI